MYRGSISLNSFAQAVSRAFVSANEQMQKDYLEAISGLKGGGAFPTPPLTIRNARIKLQANITNEGGIRRTGPCADGGDFLLDFSKPNGNFSVELEIEPYIPVTGDACEDFENEAEEIQEEPNGDLPKEDSDFAR